MTADDFLAYESDADALGDADAALSELSEFDDLDALDGFEDLDELDAFDFEDDALDALSALDDGEELDELDDAFDLMDEGNSLDELDDLELDELGDFAQQPGSALYLPRTPTLVTGPAAVAAARQLNPLVLDALRSDDADAFFRRLRNVARRVGRVVRRAGVGRILGRVGRIAGGLVRRVGPLIVRALPAIQRIAGFAGPWGRLFSAGIGAIRGLASGGGLRGALAGAVGGLVPGMGGRLASMVLRGNGADDDAAMDALADMADARRIPAAVALPVAAGLAARTVARQGLQRAGVLAPRTALVLPAARAAERIFLGSAGALPGSAGQRVRLMRLAARAAALRLGQQASPARAARAIPLAARQAAQRVMQTTRRMPRLGFSSRVAALRRLILRQRLIRRWLRQMGMPQLSMARPSA